MLIESQPETAKRTARTAHPLRAAARRVVISVNPCAGARWRRRQIAAIESSLAMAGYDVQVTTDLGKLADLTANAADEDAVRAVVAVGGDGTASSVRSHVPLDVPLLPLPLGTENLLARYVGQAATGAAVRDTLDRGVVIGLDLGRANGRHFLLMLSVGFDAEVIRRLHENRRGNITHASYVKPVVQSIRSYKYPELRLYCGENGSETSAACRWLFGFNLPLYAFGLRSAPQADGADGLLDVCTFQRGSLRSTVRYLWHVARGNHLVLADAALARCPRFRVETVGADAVAWQMDGDYGGTLPVDVDVLPGALRLLVSRRTAARLGFKITGRSGS